MKQMTWIITTLLVGILAGCNTEEPFMDELVTTSHIVTITAGSEDNATKAAISDALAFTWTTGDQIAVHTTDGYKTSSALTSGDSPSATFTVDLGEGTRQNYAVYPASAALASYATAENLRVHYADTYSYNSNADFSPMVMIAKGNAPGTNLSFKHVGALVRMTVNNIPPEATKLTFTFQYKVTGDFPVSNPDTDAPDVTTTTSESDNVVTFHLPDHAGTWWDGKVFNIPVPNDVTGSVTVAAYNGSTKIYEMSRSGLPALVRAKGTKKIIDLPKFSVSESKIVAFSPGNLQAVMKDALTDGKAGIKEWHFAPNQYDYIGAAPGNSVIDGNGTTSQAGCMVDLFHWSTMDTEDYGLNNSGTIQTGSFRDWGANIIKDGDVTYNAGTWHTLSINEWSYLFDSRTTSSSGLPSGSNSATARYTKATVCGKNGIILFPDVYYHPSVTISGSPEYNTASAAYSTFVVSSDADWIRMEKSGCVFLPASGYRHGNPSNSFTSVGLDGYYWSSDGSGSNYARYVYFSSGGLLSYTNNGWRTFGYSVRLVRDIQ